MKNRQILNELYNTDAYCITGAGGDINEWISGYEGLMQNAGIGKPKKWITGITGKDMNMEYGLTGDNRYPDDLVFLMFPLDGLDITKLAIFKIKMRDRWFCDVIDNNRMREEEKCKQAIE